MLREKNNYAKWCSVRNKKRMKENRKSKANMK